MAPLRQPRARRGALGTILAVCLAAFFVGVLAWRLSLNAIEERLDQSLILTLRALETEIDRFRYLPKVAGEDARIAAAIANPGDAVTIDAANRYLERVTELAGASHLYLMDDKGLTLAASNWQTDESFVGQDYSFRPYFNEAMRKGSGAFYAIGVTTKTPGYFLAAKVGNPAAPGVVVVKVDLVPLQNAWIAAGQTTAVADVDGVVFLSGAPDWIYRPLHPLSDAALARLTEQRTYQGAKLALAEPLLDATGNWTHDASGIRMRASTAPFGEDWQVVAAAPALPAILAALGWGAGAALATGLGLGIAQIQRQRRMLVELPCASRICSSARWPSARRR